MSLRHILVLLLVVFIWGVNFVAIKWGLQDFPPVTFAALRFFLSAFPAVFFIRRPVVSLAKIIAFGLLMFAGQFTFMFSAVHMGLSVGLVSLLLQVQAFFTIGFSAFFLRDMPRVNQVLGALVSSLGLAVVIFHIGGEAPLASLGLLMIAAASWGAGNVLTKSFGKIDMFALVVCGSFAAFVPLCGLAFYVDGADKIVDSFLNVSMLGLGATAYVVYLSTYVGFTLWNRMLAAYSAGSVAPFTLLVPVFGMLSATYILAEPYPMWKLYASLLVMVGLLVNQFGGKLILLARQQSA